MLGPLVAPLAAAMDDKRHPLHLHVVEDPAINAFALPGGYIVVNSGLILRARHAAELQGVIGSLSALSALISPLLYNSVLAEFTRPDRTNPFPGAPFGVAIIIALLTLLLVWRLPDTAKRQAP